MLQILVFTLLMVVFTLQRGLVVDLEEYVPLQICKEEVLQKCSGWKINNTHEIHVILGNPS